MSTHPILHVAPLGFPWRTPDPFLACMHHDDRYPRGDDRLGPAASLAGRPLGQDFEGRDGWRMYHGLRVPGFPQHPHRGFETVTIVRRGYVDHADSMKATARYGQGDVQWLTAGRGINHAEMFPLLERDRENPLELFQIWLNLPRASKLVEPHFKMLWSETLPRVAVDGIEIAIVAGRYGDAQAPAPPPSSWAARPDGDVAIWTIAMEPGARFTIPAAAPTSNRTLYVFRGAGIGVAGRAIPNGSIVVVRAGEPMAIENGSERTEILLLQGKPIAEPVAQHGPFVMTTREEIVQTVAEYQRTRFGGWPWPTDDPVHARDAPRFARHPDGTEERP